MQHTYKTTLDEIDARLDKLALERDDPILKRMRRDATPASDEEIFEMMDKALGDRSITDELYKIRGVDVRFLLGDLGLA